MQKFKEHSNIDRFQIGITDDVNEYGFIVDNNAKSITIEELSQIMSTTKRTDTAINIEKESSGYTSRNRS